jgi:peptidoglycan hydrolase-like protein with peptidoglycan-binding domain/3D (Asp-Asp-Asp) domain-containing protein
MRTLTIQYAWLSKIIATALALLQFLALTPTASAKARIAGEKKMLMVSAYYSPLPAQRFYMRGSYEADKKLNGNGTNGADGTQVHVGMLAAPRTYPFGTQVKIPGLGVGTVHDRGGAILALKGYDRIDVWMGSGEEGLSRALNWGMRLVEGEVSYAKDSFEPGLDYIWISSELPKSTLNRLMARTMLNPKIFSQPITKISPKADISDLQEALRMFGYYHGEVNGVYGSDTRQAVILFQIAEGVLLNENAHGAGNFGPQTQQALKTKVENFNSTVLKEQNRLKENLSELSMGLGKKDEGDKVYKMKQMLWELGYYKGELNGKYDSATMDAVFGFQKANGIVRSDREQGAGFYGKKTHQALVAAVDLKIEKLMKYPAEMQVWVPAKIDLPTVDQLSLTPVAPSHPVLSFDLKFEATKVLSASFDKDLAIGDKGESVQKLQRALIQQGFLAKGLDSGIFGAKTEKALIQFQLKKGLVKTSDQAGAGKVGPKTRALLNSLI